MKKYWTYAFYGLLLLAILVRLRAYLYNRALWFDEALLANNIIGLSWGELTGVLPNNQAAPIGFLFLEKLLVATFGNSEYSLRLWPLLAGICSLILFYQLSKKIFSPPFAILALAFLAFCQPHIYYSTELKQYGTDVLASLLVLMSTANLLDQSTQRRYVQHALLGAVLVWFSQPVVFVLAASFVALGFEGYRTKSWSITQPLLLLACSWGLSFLWYFFGFLKPSIANNHLQDFHTAYFMPLDIFTKTTWEWYGQAWFSLFRNPAGIFFKYLAGSAALLGLCFAFRQRKTWLILSLLPLALAFGASAWHQYSTIPRLLLFAMPGLLLLLVASLEWLFHQFSRRRVWGKYLSLILIGAILLQGILDTIHEMAKPEEVEEIKPLLDYLAQHRQADDLLYLYPYSAPQFYYYQKKYGLEALSVLEGSSPFDDWQADLTTMPITGQRVWLLLSHYRKGLPGNDADLYAEYFNQYGKQIVKLEEKGTVCYLYEF